MNRLNENLIQKQISMQTGFDCCFSCNAIIQTIWVLQCLRNTSDFYHITNQHKDLANSFKWPLTIQEKLMAAQEVNSCKTYFLWLLVSPHSYRDPP